MVYIDTPRQLWFKGRLRLSCHCVADSLEELHEFAAALGLPRGAFQDKPHRPHYDLFDELIDKARACGACSVPNRELILILRHHYGS